MKIASLIKQSFIDWEGKTVAVIFTNGCNFRCGYCHNPSLVLPHLLPESELIPEETIFEYLHSRKGWLDGLVITGGEPTIQPDLIDFIKKIKQLGYQVKLDTNGSRPDVLENLLNRQLIDYVAMDIKTLIKRESYRKVTGINNGDMIQHIKDSLDVLRSSSVKYQLRTTVLPDHHSPFVINKLKAQLSNDEYVLQEFREGETVESHLINC